MKIKPFKLERYFAKYEFSTPYLLSCSDCEPLTLKELLELADDETLNLWNNLWLGYTESQGHPELRNEISKIYKNINPEDLVVLAPEEGVFTFMNTFLNKDDHVIVTYPGYQSLYEIAESIECNISKWEPRTDNGFSFNIEDLKSLITEKTKLIVINFPHNPTGATISNDELHEIVKLAKQNDIFIFSDEMYRFLEYDPSQRLDSVCEIYDKGVSLFGLSKSFALPGLRIGWLCSKDKSVIKEVLTFKDYTTICNSAPSEILAIIALRAKEKIFERNLKIIKDNLKVLKEFFTKHEDKFIWNEPKAGPIAFPELKGENSALEFAQKLLEEKGIMILPSCVYDYPRNNIRIGFGRKNLAEILGILDGKHNI